MNLWTWVGVDEPGSRVEGGEPVLCDYAPELGRGGDEYLAREEGVYPLLFGGRGWSLFGDAR
jgi:hypothetical protein